MESAGLGEAAHFLRKARQNISYAQFTMENIDQSARIAGANSKIDEIIVMIAEALAYVQNSEIAMVTEAEEVEDAQPHKER